ncbi:MAG: hypothetical protein IJ165_03405 [Proteobacteria bacterium]|nr:hypothetical protein [Pseudomonadota bacterium]
MSHELNIGTQIPLENGNTATIMEKLGEGGQGTVYRVSIDGKDYALKWYFPERISKPKDFYENLKNNIEKGSPNDAFLWPKFLTTNNNGRFGYIMDLRPKNYRDFSEILLNKVNFNALSTVVMAAINIVNGFRDLHRNGYSYQDLNDGNFFIDTDTGSVLICDNDNVAPYGTSLGIAGKARYMAPEVVRSKMRPDNITDRFSLAVVLFLLFFRNHPLEGQRLVQCPCLTEELELKFYGKDPVFICDPERDNNRPVPDVHDNVIRLWPLFPAFFREIFQKVFSKDCLHRDRNRPTDNEWQIALTNLRSCIATCPNCGQETFMDESLGRCINCNISIPKQRILVCKDDKYKVVLFPGNKLYRCHTDSTSDDYQEITGEIIRNPKNPQLWGIKNLTQDCWNTEGAESKMIPPGGVLIITRTSRITFSASCSADIIF